MEEGDASLQRRLLAVFPCHILCGRLVLGQGAKVLSGVAQGFVHHILEEVDGQKEEQGDQREDEGGEVNGDVEAIRETHNAHEP